VLEGGYPSVLEGGYPSVLEGGYPSVLEGGYPSVLEGGYPSVLEGNRARRVARETRIGQYGDNHPVGMEFECQAGLMRSSCTASFDRYMY
jgi:hypothetical protein